MITFLTSFKPFIGPDRRDQRSALWSWHYNALPVITADNDKFIAVNCQDFDNVTLLQGVQTARSLNFDTDSLIIRDLLRRSLELITTPMVGIINGDVIILRGFLDTLERIVNSYGENVFLSGTRFDIDLDSELNSEEQYNAIHQMKRNIYNEVNSADIFIMSKEKITKLSEDMAPLIWGRYGWDNWIHFWMQINDAPHYNCTEALPTLHCIHDHSHIEKQEGRPGRKALSSVHNLTQLMPMQKLYGTTVRINKWPRVEV